MFMEKEIFSGAKAELGDGVEAAAIKVILEARQGRAKILREALGGEDEDD